MPISPRNPYDDFGTDGQQPQGRWSGLLRQGDNPMLWAVPLGSIARIAIRLSILYVILVAFQLGSAFAKQQSLIFPVIALSTLFVLVLLHEFGHCIACRATGGTADEILIWPLGGLASCMPEPNWKANLITTVGGPLVNLVLWPVLALGLLAAGAGADALVFNPFSPMAALAALNAGWPLTILWFLYYNNFVLLAFNLVVPMFPMDCGRIVQALLWRKVGFNRSMQIAVSLGLGVAVVLGLVGVLAEQMTLFGIAVFGGVTCYAERQRLKYAEFQSQAEPESPYAKSAQNVFEDDTDSLDAKRARKERSTVVTQEPEAVEADPYEAAQLEVDRILAKIAKTGLKSLSNKERKALEAATEAKRRQAAR